MLIDFDLLPGDSRVWIYQSDRKLTATEVDLIHNEAGNFIEQWTAHEQTLKAGFKVMHDIFLIMGVDQSHNDASGCSIDKSVHFIQSIEKKLNVNLLNRFNVVYTYNGEFEILHFSKFKSLLRENKIPQPVKVFDNLVTTKADLTNKWLVNVGESWVGEKTI